ncbi:MAG: glycosyltransferase [Dysgonamonadaceae bacterium]|jgi:glycosyltransferase involved in cell wall biosynthesis|nr:glycosyltransferase [Dysgonamonadaceae bacterium]
MFFETGDIPILTTLFVCWVIQMLCYWACLAKPYYYQRAVEERKIRFDQASPPVSLIIYARNDAKKLANYLPTVLEQDYPHYEVIVVDDCLSDDTEVVWRRISSQYNHFYYTYIPPESKNVSRKKLALALGIKAAHYDSLLFLDDDSHPVSSDWLRLMARHLVGEKTIVLGFSALKNQSCRYAVYDYFFSDLQMMSLALIRRPYMGNGKNLGYLKSEFVRQRTFSKFSVLEAGEDDLLINELAGRDNVSVELSPNSVTQVDMDESWMWKELKIKRMITFPLYRKFPVIFWGIEKASRMLFYFLFIYSFARFFFHWQLSGATAILFLIRAVTQWMIINKTAKRLQLPKFHANLLFFDFIQPLVNGYFYLCGIFRSKRRGYGRYGR